MSVQSAPAVGLIQLRAKILLRCMMSSTLRNISSTVQSVSARTVAERGYKLMQVISPKRSPASERGNWIVVVQIHRRINGNPMLAGFFFAFDRSAAA